MISPSTSNKSLSFMRKITNTHRHQSPVCLTDSFHFIEKHRAISTLLYPASFPNSSSALCIMHANRTSLFTNKASSLLSHCMQHLPVSGSLRKLSWTEIRKLHCLALHSKKHLDCGWKYCMIAYIKKDLLRSEGITQQYSPSETRNNLIEQNVAEQDWPYRCSYYARLG